MYGGRYQDGPVSTEYMSLAESDESLEAEGLAYANCALLVFIFPPLSSFCFVSFHLSSLLLLLIFLKRIAY